MQLTRHFSTSEFAQKSGHGLPGLDYPDEWITTRLLPLCNELEVLRDVLGKPVRVISGFRSEQYNKRIGGARLSQHVEGRAADIVIPGVEAEWVHDTVLDLVKAGKMRIGGLGHYPRFVHIDVRSSKRLVRWTGSRT